MILTQEVDLGGAAQNARRRVSLKYLVMMCVAVMSVAVCLAVMLMKMIALNRMGDGVQKDRHLQPREGEGKPANHSASPKERSPNFAHELKFSITK